MKTQKRICSLIGALVLSARAVSPSLAQMTVQIVNLNPAYGYSNIYVSFVGTPTISGAIGGGGITLGSNYTATAINGGCIITNFTAGAKIAIALGQPLTSGNAGNLFAWNFNNPSLADYYTRWDKVELSYVTNNNFNTANLTADDFASIPLKVDNGVNKLDWHFQGTMQGLLGSLAALCGTNALAVAVTNGQILRVISPHTSYNAPWPTLQAYAGYAQTNGMKVNVAGSYLGSGQNTNQFSFQTYNLMAFFTNGGSLMMTGSCSVVGSTTIEIAPSDLSLGLYSAAPNYTVNGVLTNNSNCVYDAAVRDILAAFNLGLPCTTRIDPRTSVAFTNEATQVWYNYPANGVVSTSLDPTNVFGALWGSGTNFYNQFANILSTNTDAYGFPFSDTLFKPLLPLTGNPTLTITILPDTGSTPPPATGMYFSHVAVTGGVATLTLTNLTVGSSNSIDRTSNLSDANSWQNVTNFIATGYVTNYSEAVRATNTFFRARHP